MKPILFDAGATSFSGNGLGILGDAISCLVTREANRSYEVELEYPADGVHAGEISGRRILLCPSEPGGTPQPFRIYSVSTPMNGVLIVRGRHVAYDLMGYPVSPFTVYSAAGAIAALSSYCPVQLPFTFSLSGALSGTDELKVKDPTDIWTLLGDGDKSIRGVYGGDWEFDGFSVTLHASRGENRHVTVRYGKNMTDIDHEENLEDTWTGVYPYYSRGTDQAPVTVSGLIVYPAGVTSDYTRILPLSLNSEFEEEPSASALLAKAQEYITKNRIWEPKIAADVSFEPLQRSGEYENVAALEQIRLFDTLEVYHTGLGIYVTKKASKTVMDVLLDQYDSLTVGEEIGDLAGEIVRSWKAGEN